MVKLQRNIKRKISKYIKEVLIMRTSNSVKNSITSTISSIITMLFGFVAQAIFIRILGAEYLGLNGLFTNILTILSFFDLGIGNAIVFHLYKPLATNDTKQIKSLMRFYRNAYNIISILVFTGGLLLLPFLHIIVGSITVDVNIYVIYLMFLISTASSYTLSYRRNLIMANQKSYISNIVHIIYIIVLNIMQIALLYLTKNYYLYLGIKIICQIIENVVCYIIATKMYPILAEKNIDPLDSKTKKDIFEKVKGLIFHTASYSIVCGTDNIIISTFLGVITVGLYTNYNTIIGSVNNLFTQIISSTTASVGNLLVSNKDSKARFNVFKKIRFINFWAVLFSGVSILVIMDSFIKIWVGAKYVLPLFVLVILVINYYQKVMRNSFSTFKDAAGIWIEDKFVPLVEAIANIVFSIVLLKIFGLAGVFMGTIVSGLVIWCYSYPKFVYKKLFNRSYKDYAKETIGYILLFVLIAAFTFYISRLIVFNNIWLQFISNTVVSLIIPNLILFIIFRKTDNFKYLMELIHKLLAKLKKRSAKTC